MNDTKYAYASEDPHESPSFFAFGSHGLPLRHASIMFGHDSPVAHLEIPLRRKNSISKELKDLKKVVNKFQANFNSSISILLPNLSKHQCFTSDSLFYVVYGICL